MGRFFRNLLHHFAPGHGNAYRPRLLARPWLLFFLTIVLTVEGVFLASTQVSLVDRFLPAAVVQSDVVVFTNSQRVQYGAGILTEDPFLSKAAQAKAEDMASKGYFSHVSPDGTLPWAWVQRAGYVYRYAGENLAVRFDDSSAVVGAWMASPSHRENIVKPEYTHIGIGIAQGVYEGTPTTFVVQYFGTPLARAAAAPPAETSAEPTAPQSVAMAQSGGRADTGVAGAVTSVAPVAATPNVTQTTMQQFLRAVADNPASTAVALGAVAVVLALAVVLGFGMRLQVQPVEMLLGGVLVVALALFFVAFNERVIGVSTTAQEAALGALAEPSGLIGGGVATEMYAVQ